MKPALALALGGGLGVLLLALSARPAAARELPMDPITAWIPNILRSTSAHEGQFWSVQKNLDGNGVSYGILQWTQKSGSLGKLLSAMQAADPSAFGAFFGPSSSKVLEVTKRASLEPVDGVPLWQEPWVSRFVAAGRAPVFQRVQQEQAATSEYMQGAVAIARSLGVLTERGVALAFDRCVQQGVAGATGPANRLLAWYAEDPRRRPQRPNDVLAQYGWMCANRFRRTGAPQQRCFNTACNLWWGPVSEEWGPLSAGSDYRVQRQRVSGVWHVLTGPRTRPWSLYDLVTQRSSAVLTDAGLGDVVPGRGAA